MGFRDVRTKFFLYIHVTWLVYQCDFACTCPSCTQPGRDDSLQQTHTHTNDLRFSLSPFSFCFSFTFTHTHTHTHTHMHASKYGRGVLSFFYYFFLSFSKFTLSLFFVHGSGLTNSRAFLEQVSFREYRGFFPYI